MSSQAGKNELTVNNETLPVMITESDKNRTGSAVEREAEMKIENSRPNVVILKTISTDDSGSSVDIQHETVVSVEAPVATSASRTKGKSHQNHWTPEAEKQLVELIEHYRSQGNSGPLLWQLVSSKCDYNFTADQCMSKWYREKTRERYKTEGKKRKDPSATVKWDAEGTARLNSSVELIKGQEHEGSTLWRLVAESLEDKWTAAQCMNKYYRDRHKQQKLQKIDI